MNAPSKPLHDDSPPRHAPRPGAPAPAPDLPAWYPRLLRLLDEQVSLARRLDDLGVRQRQHVEEGDLPGVLDVLAQRDPIVAALSLTAEEVEPFVRDVRSPGSTLGDLQRGEVRDRLAELERLLDAVNARDAGDEAALVGMRDSLAAEIATVRKGRAALGAYSPAGPSVPTLQDRQG